MSSRYLMLVWYRRPGLIRHIWFWSGSLDLIDIQTFVFYPRTLAVFLYNCFFFAWGFHSQHWLNTRWISIHLSLHSLYPSIASFGISSLKKDYTRIFCLHPRRPCSEKTWTRTCTEKHAVRDTKSAAPKCIFFNLSPWIRTAMKSAETQFMQANIMWIHVSALTWFS